MQSVVTFLFSPHVALEVFGCAEPTCAQLWGWVEVPCSQGLMSAVPWTLLTCPSLPRLTLDFPRSWLLPVLRDYVQGARLCFFTSYFLPLAAALKSRGETGGIVGVPVGAVLHAQGSLWDLPSIP